MRTFSQTRAGVRAVIAATTAAAIFAFAGMAAAQNQAGTTTVNSPRSCSSSSVGHCLGCSISCPASRIAICRAGNSHPQFGCTVIPSCVCEKPDDKVAFLRPAPRLFSPAPAAR
ncbi:hypothetical protein CFHF_03070 [Caulobacter flavus]|uniref:4Fe-4S ferredoxin-type domain-containing protein n=1 Tax=Caulobacter flavus TaxID=1679497 RepID=A0A2N5CZ18_9CAUL|nr:hypothetical protein [Caulobacter flavus]AYV45315.1 hypothetical protein C1707_03105 [Caulobacter flavus]PLR19006.1 hypothetical protein CFHF_03070 [Caulobacter flavus]